jgi:hypothetical protein
MAADCAVELRQHNVAFVSLWPGAVVTEDMDVFTQNQEGVSAMVRRLQIELRCNSICYLVRL